MAESASRKTGSATSAPSAGTARRRISRSTGRRRMVLTTDNASPVHRRAAPAPADVGGRPYGGRMSHLMPEPLATWTWRLERVRNGRTVLTRAQAATARTDLLNDRAAHPESVRRVRGGVATARRRARRALAAGQPPRRPPVRDGGRAASGGAGGGGERYAADPRSTARGRSSLAARARSRAGGAAGAAGPVGAPADPLSGRGQDHHADRGRARRDPPAQRGRPPARPPTGPAWPPATTTGRSASWARSPRPSVRDDATARGWSRGLSGIVA